MNVGLFSRLTAGINSRSRRTRQYGSGRLFPQDRRHQGRVAGRQAQERNPRQLVQLRRHQHRHRRLATSAPAAARSNVQDMHFTKVVDKASPNLFFGCATGKHYRQGDVTVRKAGEKPQEYLIYKLTEVLHLVDHRPAATRAAGSPQESVSLNFSKVELAYTPQNADGTPARQNTKGYDLKATSSYELRRLRRQATVDEIRRGGTAASPGDRPFFMQDCQRRVDRQWLPNDGHQQRSPGAAADVRVSRRASRSATPKGGSILREARRAGHRAAPRDDAAAPISEVGPAPRSHADLSSISSTPPISTPPRTCARRRKCAARSSTSAFPISSAHRSTRTPSSDVAREIEMALRDFEPRLAPQFDQGRRDDTRRRRGIEAAVSWSRPICAPSRSNVPVEFVAEVELDSGKIKIDRL